ncbi:hypothetical protein L1987_65342 [Smallanthus sonchifolius]|uniref:Uncharacterized protein n=1 Tax=Smallanthus sonchifolius TaxID=185202 RepID=A0ACB9BU22_9ASTR|nr:hypothetical protein L1987_65342 [Smallanthus sonchifolius]
MATHVMVFPWLAFGHMLPFLKLSLKLAANVDGLPENCEATIDIQQDETQYLKKAYDNLKSPFQKLLENDTPDLILIDFSPYWVPEIAAKYGVSTGFFSVYTAATLAYMGPPDELRWGRRRETPEAFTIAPDWFTFHSIVAHRPDYAPTMLRNLHVPDEFGKSSGQRISTIIEACEFASAKLLVEKGLGYEVPRSEDGSFSRDMVTESVKLVMESQEGEAIREKASQMSSFFCDQNVQEKYISSFVSYLQRFKRSMNPLLEYNSL